MNPKPTPSDIFWLFTQMPLQFWRNIKPERKPFTMQRYLKKTARIDDKIAYYQKKKDKYKNKLII